MRGGRSCPPNRPIPSLDLKLFHRACILATVVLSFGTFQIQRLKDEEEGKKNDDKWPLCFTKIEFDS